jgi:hypothetical protein
MASPCAPLPGPPFEYLCEDGTGAPTTSPAMTVGGVRVAQGPLVFCGTGERVCAEEAVSSCLSDTDGNPTTYGPSPDAPAPADVTGRSPRFSRLRVNRVGLTVFPYSSTKKPDQLFDLVIDGGEEDDIPVPWDSATGRFTIPAAEAFPTLPVPGCGLDEVEGEWIVVGDYASASDSDAVLGNATVLDSGDGEIVRCLAQPVIDNVSCRGQYVFANVAAGFGFSPVTPTAQVRYGVRQNGVILQEFQSPPFSGGWQKKDSYLYVPSVSLAAGDFQDEHYELFAEVVNPGDEVIWVDADLGVDKWYGSGAA